MRGANGKTLASYDLHVPEYVAGTSHIVSGATKDWIDASLADLPPTAAILEIGSAFGRDAAYVAAQGYAIQCTDAAEGFVRYLCGIGRDAERFDVLTDAFEADYDLVLANAVLLHFEPDEFTSVLGKLCQALRPDGRLAFSLKQGDGEEWSDAKLNAPRYFCYWQSQAIPPLLSQAGFRDWTILAARTARTHADWLFVIAHK